MNFHYVIYRHTSPSGKSYIGKVKIEDDESATDAMMRRWKAHVRHPLCRAIHGAIRKYGQDNFKHEILDILTTKKGADSAERAWIDSEGTKVPKGYNLRGGGEGGVEISEETRQRKSESMKKVWKSPGYRERLKASQIACNEERRRNHSEMSKRLTCSSSMRAHMSVLTKRFWQAPENRRRMIAAQIAAQNDLTESKRKVGRRRRDGRTPSTDRSLQSAPGTILSTEPSYLNALRQGGPILSGEQKQWPQLQQGGFEHEPSTRAS